MCIRDSSDSDRYNHLVLLCENQEGYRNLLKLVSTAFLEGFYYKPRIDKDLLARHSKGLIAMSACLRGDINETILANRYEEAKRLAYSYADMFGKENFFLEIQDHGLDQDKVVIPELLRLSEETRIPLVATNDSHYMRKNDARAHEILLCIQTGKTMSDPNRMRFTVPEFYLKTRDEMLAMFGEMEAALDRTWDIAQRCQVSLEKVKEPFPKFDVPAEHSTDSYFEYAARQGFELSLIHIFQFIDFTTKAMGLDVGIEQFSVPVSSGYASKSLIEAQLRKGLGVIVLAIRKSDGEMLFNPPAEAEIQAGDFLIVMGEAANLRKLEQLLAEVRT